MASGEIIKIAHRGNFPGQTAEENTKEAVFNALNANYDVEIDIWAIDGKLYLGHDQGKEPVDREFLENPNLWCHLKNLEAVRLCFDTNIHWFFHINDPMALTSFRYIWVHKDYVTEGHNVINVILHESQYKEGMIVRGIYGDNL